MKQVSQTARYPLGICIKISHFLLTFGKCVFMCECLRFCVGVCVRMCAVDVQFRFKLTLLSFPLFVHNFKQLGECVPQEMSFLNCAMSISTHIVCLLTFCSVCRLCALFFSIILFFYKIFSSVKFAAFINNPYPRHFRSMNIN